MTHWIYPEIVFESKEDEDELNRRYQEALRIEHEHDIPVNKQRPHYFLGNAFSWLGGTVDVTEHLSRQF